MTPVQKQIKKGLLALMLGETAAMFVAVPLYLLFRHAGEPNAGLVTLGIGWVCGAIGAMPLYCELAD